MNSLEKRLGALEAAQPTTDTGSIDLDALTDADLNRLEEIVIRREGSQTIESLSDDDLCFIAALTVLP